MLLRALIVLCVLAPRPALAEDHGMFPIEEMVRGLAGTKSRVQGVYASIGPGWEPTRFVALQAELGYARGMHDSGLFATTSVWHLSLGLRGRVDLKDDERDLDLTVLGGWSAISLGSIGIAGGLDARLSSDLRAGPVVKGRVGIGQFHLFALGGLLFGDDTSGVFCLGLEVVRVPRI